MLVALSLLCSALSPDPPPAKPARAKRNKYAHFSKAERVAETLRFSRVAPPEQRSGGAEAAAAAAAAAAELPRERGVWLYPDAAQVDQRDPSTFGFSEVGRVVGAHGTQGVVRVLSDSDFAEERLCRPGVGWLRRPRRRAPRQVRLLSGRRGPGAGAFLLRIAGVEAREEAAALKGSTLYVRREQEPEGLEEGELLSWQLEGLRVVCLDRDAPPDAASLAELAGEPVGLVSGVVPALELSSAGVGHDLLEVTLFPPSPDGGDAPPERLDQLPDDADTVLVPYVEEIVPAVDTDAGLVLIDPPAGLLELVQPKRRRRVTIRGLLPAAGETHAPPES